MRRLPEQRCVCLIHQRGQAWSALEWIDRNLGHLWRYGRTEECWAALRTRIEPKKNNLSGRVAGSQAQN
jgi:hypothetical protein